MACIWMLFCLPPHWAIGQTTTDQTRAEQQRIADRFLEVLLRNPRPGTALDRVYSFHVQNQSLDKLLQSLDVSDDDDRAGAYQMIRGMIHFLRGNTADSITTLQKAESLLVDNASVSHELAKVLIAAGQNDAAAEALERAIERKPDRRDAPDIYLELGKLYARNGKTDLAVDIWKQLTARFDDDAIAEKVAAALTQEQQFDVAMDQYLQLAKRAKSPESRIGYEIKVADLRNRLGQTERSRDELISILDRLRPGSWLYTDVRTRIERSFLSSGDLDGLVEYYSDQARRSPEDISVLVRLAEIQAGKGRVIEAEETLRNVIERAPKEVDARMSLVEILVDDGRHTEAAVHLNHLIDLQPDHPDYLLRLGEIHLGDLRRDPDRRTRSAAEAWNRIVIARPDDAVMLSAVARKMQSIGFSDRATELYRQAILAAPDSPQFREYLGEHFFRLRRIDDAIRAWRSIAEGPRRDSASLLRLAEVFETFQMTDRALEIWREAATLDLTFEQRLRFSRVLSESDEHDDALVQLEIASKQAQTSEEQESLLHCNVEALQAAARVPQRIRAISLQPPSAENQRLLALLFQADGQLHSAWSAIGESLKLEPDQIPVLIDAVDIAERLGKRDQACEMLETLADIDRRFTVNHLRRLVQIREQMGQTDQALAAAQKLIDANPASPDTYLLLSRIAFDAGRDELGEQSLRRAILVDPRAIAPRVTLAKRLAERFKTSAAIDLLWQAVEIENRLHAQIDLIRQLVPLYARRGQIEDMVERIARIDLGGSDLKSKQILIASVWVSVGDYNQARFEIQQMLTDRPRDIDLLRAMIDISLESGDEESAVTFQRRLVDVDDSPDHQIQLASLELKAGLISPLEARSREIGVIDDAARLASVITRDADKDPETSAELARVALERRPELWDIRIIRAQLLLLSDSLDRKNDLAEADRLAGEVASLGLARDATPPSRSSPQLPITQQPVPSVNGNGDQSRYPQSTAATLHRILRFNDRRVISRVYSGSKSFSFPLGASFVAPVDYSQAYWIARCVQVLSHWEREKIAGRKTTPLQIIEERFPTPNLDTDDVAALRETIALHGIQAVLSGTDDQPPEQLVWRIAELDPSGDHPALLNLLKKRSEQTPKSDSVAPLDDRKLVILERLCAEHRQLAVTMKRSLQTMVNDLKFRRCLASEFRLAGKELPLTPDSASPDRVAVNNRLPATRTLANPDYRFATRSQLEERLQQHANTPAATASPGPVISLRSAPPRLSHTRESDFAELLELANAFLESGDQVTASEVAYSILNQHETLTYDRRSDTRRQAIDILARTNQLQPLITATERKFRSSPDSDSYRHELAELYLAAGKPEQANQLWEELIVDQQLSPRQIIIRASTLRGRREYHPAAMWYLFAVERDPELWQTHWSVFSDAAKMSKWQDAILQRLCNLDIRSFPLYSLCSLIRPRDTEATSETRQQFTRLVLQNHPDTSSNLDLLLDAIPRSQRSQFPRLKTMMIQAITADESFRRESSLWAIRGWSESGKVRGVFEDLMHLLHHDAEAAEAFLAAVDTPENDDQDDTCDTRRLLRAAYELDSVETRDSAADRIRNLCPATFDAAPSSQPSKQLPAGLLWQIGQWVASIEPITDRTMLQIGLFEAAVATAPDVRIATSSVMTPIDQLYQSYADVGRKDLARRGWIDGQLNYEYPKTTGARENRQLQVAAHAATELLKIGFPIDAAGICRPYLNQQLTFRLAGRYSQGQNHHRILSNLYTSAMDSVNQENAEDYLKEVLPEVDDGKLPRLHPVNVKNSTRTPNDCLFEFAVRTASQSDSGRDVAEALLDRLNSYPDPEKTPLTSLAVRLILASVVRPPDIALLLEDLFQRLPPESAPDLADAHQLVFALAAVRRSEVEPADAAIEQVIEDILVRLMKVARDGGDRDCETALARLSRTPASIQIVLDSIVDTKQPGPLPKSECEYCLELAKQAAEKDQWNIVANALEVALGDGFPVFSESKPTHAADEFGGLVMTRRVRIGEDALDTIRDQVLAILGTCRDSQGVPVTSPMFDFDQISIAPEPLKALDRSLRRLMFPSELMLNVYAYKQPVLSRAETDDATASFMTQSVSYASANVAQACGSTPSLVAQIRKRSTASGAQEITSLLVDLTLHCDDIDVVSDAVDRFRRSVDDRLPWLSAELQDSASDQPVRKPIPPRSAAPIVEICDQILQTLWPLTQRTGLPPDVNETLGTLLLRTAKLLRSNDQTSVSHAQVIRTIEAACG